MLWCMPSFLRNEWNHAFKTLAQGGSMFRARRREDLPNSRLF